MGGGCLYIPRADFLFLSLVSATLLRGVSGLVQRYEAGNGPGVG